MRASVLNVERNRLLVVDLANRQRVIVNTPNTGRFCPGDVIRIRYNGMMSKSIPPQIYALNIFKFPWGNRSCGSYQW